MKMTKLFASMIICTALTACGPEEPTSSETAVEIETTAEAAMAAENTEKAAQSQADPISEDVYEDNFAVEPSAAAAFAEKIKAAVAARDLEALADLTDFPVYVSIANDIVQTREDFTGLGAENVFTPGLISSVEGADTSMLPPSMAGFSVSKDGKSNIIFGVVDGRLAISGINYE